MVKFIVKKHQNNGTMNYVINDRGYTLHEHYDNFGLINMNGMVYDTSKSTVFSHWTIRIDELSLNDNQ